MGFFGFFDYGKPGKGVDVNAPPKPPFFLFFELLWRKFSRFVVLNMFLFVIVFPLITMLYFGYYSLADELLPEENIYGQLASLEEQAAAGETASVPFSFLPTLLFTLYLSLPRPVYTALLALSAICYGPAMCGMTYVLRNYVNQDHAWFSDFFVRMKRNFLQGSINGVLELAVIVLLGYNITAVLEEGASSFDAGMMSVVRMMSFALLILLFFMRHYTYLIIVTFDLKLRHIWKNAFIFGALNLWKNLLCSAVILLMVFLVLIVPYADILLLPFFYLSFTGFLTLFVCQPIVYKYMVKKEPEEEEGHNAIEENATEETE